MVRQADQAGWVSFSGFGLDRGERISATRAATTEITSSINPNSVSRKPPIAGKPVVVMSSLSVVPEIGYPAEKPAVPLQYPESTPMPIARNTKDAISKRLVFIGVSFVWIRVRSDYISAFCDLKRMDNGGLRAQAVFGTIVTP